MEPPPPEIIHASCVSLDGRAALILGPSGSGKSALALQLMAGGALLVADDRTVLRREGALLMAEAPPAIAGLIEARGMGIFRTRQVISAPVALVVDLSQTEDQRLPEPRTHRLCDLTFPCLRAVPGPHFAAAVLLCLKGTLLSAT